MWKKKFDHWQMFYLGYKYCLLACLGRDENKTRHSWIKKSDVNCKIERSDRGTNDSIYIAKVEVSDDQKKFLVLSQASMNVPKFVQFMRRYLCCWAASIFFFFDNQVEEKKSAIMHIENCLGPTFMGMKKCSTQINQALKTELMTSTTE